MLVKLAAAPLLCLSTWATSIPAFASGTYAATHVFTAKADGAEPSAPVTFDDFGNYYGETLAGADPCADGDTGGGSVGCGTIYRMSQTGELTTLLTFTGPNGASGYGQLSLVGNTLYGSASAGGADDMGVLFSVDTDGNNFKLLHQFNGRDGSGPRYNLIPLSAGGFYGVTTSGGPSFGTGGAYQKGELFKLTRNGTLIPLHEFSGEDGSFPEQIIVDSSGTIYGATDYGGKGCGNIGCGTIYSYAPAQNKFTTLYSFSGHSDGSGPSLGSIGPDGTLYGATALGGADAAGTLFALTPSNGTYSLKTIHSFSGKDGGDPGSGPTLLPNGSLIGATYSNLYLFDQNLPGKVESLYAFSTNPSLGGGAVAQPVVGPNGMLYGTLQVGGTSPCVTSAGIPLAGCGALYTYTRAAN